MATAPTCITKFILSLSHSVSAHRHSRILEGEGGMVVFDDREEGQQEASTNERAAHGATRQREGTFRLWHVLMTDWLGKRDGWVRVTGEQQNRWPQVSSPTVHTHRYHILYVIAVRQILLPPCYHIATFIKTALYALLSSYNICVTIYNPKQILHWLEINISNAASILAWMLRPHTTNSQSPLPLYTWHGGRWEPWAEDDEVGVCVCVATPTGSQQQQHQCKHLLLYCCWILLLSLLLCTPNHFISVVVAVVTMPVPHYTSGCYAANTCFCCHASQTTLHLSLLLLATLPMH